MVHSTNRDKCKLKITFLISFTLWYQVEEEEEEDYHNVGIEVQICEGQGAYTLKYEMDDDYFDWHEALDDKGCQWLE